MRRGAAARQTGPRLQRNAPCVYESGARSENQESIHMANGNNPIQPPPPGNGKVSPAGGVNKPPQVIVVAAAAAVGGLVGGVVGAMIGSGMHP